MIVGFLDGKREGYNVARCPLYHFLFVVGTTTCRRRLTPLILWGFESIFVQVDVVKCSGSCRKCGACAGLSNNSRKPFQSGRSPTPAYHQAYLEVVGIGEGISNEIVSPRGGLRLTRPYTRLPPADAPEIHRGRFGNVHLVR